MLPPWYLDPHLNNNTKVKHKKTNLSRSFWDHNDPPFICNSLILTFTSGGIPWLQKCKQELVNGYEQNATNATCLKTLVVGSATLSHASNIGGIDYLFHKGHFILDFLLALVGILGMIVFGYGIYRGRINLQKVIDDQSKLTLKLILRNISSFLRCFSWLFRPSIQ